MAHYFNYIKSSQEFKDVITSYQKQHHKPSKTKESISFLIELSKRRADGKETSEEFLYNDLVTNKNAQNELMNTYGGKVFTKAYDNSRFKKDSKMSKVKLLRNINNISHLKESSNLLMLPSIVHQRVKTDSSQLNQTKRHVPSRSSVHSSTGVQLTQFRRRSNRKINMNYIEHCNQTKEDCIDISKRYHCYFNSHDYGTNEHKQKYDYLKSIFE